MSSSLENMLFNEIVQFYQGLNLSLITKTGFYIFLGIIITLYFSRLVGHVLEKNVSTHHAHILKRLTFYIGLVLSFLIPLRAVGIDVTTLLGAAGVAAGIVTAAVAFASQTVISNFLSGVFLLAEKPFQIGDTIQVNNNSGEVLSIDLLSVKIRTSDNTLIRIPNELLIKTQFKNQTRFPIRRCDILLHIAIDQELEKVKKVLMDLARQNPLCLVSPEPEFHFIEFTNSALVIRFSVWSKQSSFSALKTNLQIDIQAAFEQFDIKRPFLPSHQEAF